MRPHVHPVFSTPDLDIRYVHPRNGEPLCIFASGVLDMNGALRVEEAIRYIRRQVGPRPVRLDLQGRATIRRGGMDMLIRLHNWLNKWRSSLLVLRPPEASVRELTAAGVLIADADSPAGASPGDGSIQL